MVFSELYSAYYNAVARMIEYAQQGVLTKESMYAVAKETAFGESVLTIVPAIESERWQIIGKELKTCIKNKPEMPLTTLEKRWLKAISLDPKMKLFSVDFSFLEDVEPLFTNEDIVLFDKYLDGDDYEDEGYIERFRAILYAIENEKSLEIYMINRRGEEIKRHLQPKRLEYSKKDDKFRLIARGIRCEETINLQKITRCRVRDEKLRFERRTHKRKAHYVTFELVDERKALERVLLHFAHFEKEAVQTGEDTYTITIWYDSLDETEIVIRLLSFGQFVKVTEPDSFVDLIKERLIKQKECFGK